MGKQHSEIVIRNNDNGNGVRIGFKPLSPLYGNYLATIENTTEAVTLAKLWNKHVCGDKDGKVWRGKKTDEETERWEKV